MPMRPSFLRIAGVSVPAQAGFQARESHAHGELARMASGVLRSTLQSVWLEWSGSTAPLDAVDIGILKGLAPHGTIQVVSGAFLGGDGGRAVLAQVLYESGSPVRVADGAGVSVSEVLQIKLVQADRIGVLGSDGNSVDYAGTGVGSETGAVATDPVDTNAGYDPGTDQGSEPGSTFTPLPLPTTGTPGDGSGRNGGGSDGTGGRSETPVQGEPVPVFLVSPVQGALDTLFTLDATASAADAATATYFWDFGDGETAEGVVVTHKYKREGSWAVRLVLQDVGGMASRSTFINVSGALAVSAVFTYQPLGKVTTGIPVHFDAALSRGVLVNYDWDFGDSVGATGVTPDATHTYLAAGTYTVKLRVRDIYGSSAEAARTIDIVAADIAAAFTVTPQSGDLQTLFRVDGSSSKGEGLTYAWDFGDSATATGATTSHAYPTEGTFTITLVVTDTNGATATATRAVGVGAQHPPEAPSVTVRDITTTSAVLAGGPFVDADFGSTHKDSKWQVSTDPTFATTIFDQSWSNTPLNSAPVTGLTAATDYYARGAYRDNLDNESPWSSTVQFHTLTGAELQPPGSPGGAGGTVPTPPTWGEPVQNWPTGPNGTGSGSGSGTTGGGATPPPGAGQGGKTGPASGGTPGSGGPKTIEPGTGATGKPDTPTVKITNAVEGGLITGTIAQAVATPFVGHGTLQTATRWQVATGKNFDTVVYDSFWDASHLTARAIFNLKVQQYSIRVAYMDSNNQPSDWSAVVHFTVVAVTAEDATEIWRLIHAAKPGACIAAYDRRFSLDPNQSGRVAALWDARKELRNVVPPLYAGVSGAPQFNAETGAIDFDAGSRLQMRSGTFLHDSSLKTGKMAFVAVLRLIDVEDQALMKLDGPLHEQRLTLGYESLMDSATATAATATQTLVGKDNNTLAAAGGRKVWMAYRDLNSVDVHILEKKPPDNAPGSWGSTHGVFEVAPVDFLTIGGAGAFELCAVLVLNEKLGSDLEKALAQWALDKHGATFDVDAAPTTPTLTVAPANDTASMQGDEYADGNAPAVDGEPTVKETDTHEASRWQVALEADTQWAAPVFDSGWDTTNLTSIVVTGLTPQVAYRGRLAYRDSRGAISGWSQTVHFTTEATQVAPAKPVLTLGVLSDEDVTLNIGPFQDANAGGTHAATQWMVSLPDAQGGATFYDSGWNTTRLLDVDVFGLFPSSPYVAKARVKDNAGLISDWSDSVPFTSQDSYAPNKPTVLITDLGMTTVSVASTLFSDPNNNRRHVASQFLFLRADNGAVVYDSGWETDHLLAYSIRDLTPENHYTVQVRHQDATGLSSPYSDATPFTTTTVLERTTVGLIFADDFNRANGGIGANWDSWSGGEMTIVGNQVDTDSTTAHRANPNTTVAPETGGPICVQAKMRARMNNGGTGAVGFLLRAPAGNHLTKAWMVYYQDTYLYLSKLTPAFSVVSGSQLFPTAASMNSLKAMAYDGHIKTWHNGSPVQSIADTSLDGSTGTAHLYQDAYVSGSQHAYYDDFWMTRGNTIQVTGLPTGWKASVAGVTAVEVGGTATIDLAGADLKQAGVSILDASGAVKGNTAPANGVWGGDVFTYHAPAP